ncbi:MAG: class I SAM-dependent methyltransferase [Candidatus Tectomicrobia bacterium]|nr:class I SAM-dependent methyltransferase [Candidatus Tectomicrobia bacterium]
MDRLRPYPPPQSSRHSYEGQGVSPSESAANSLRPHRADFDGQADIYDQRVGLSDAVCVAIAQAVLTLAEIRPGDLIVEMGAGTGLIGRLLAQSMVRYVGVDLSRAMLTRFRQRLETSRPAGLLQADGNHQWPLGTGSARVIFSSRAMHWLASDHVVAETFRVVCPDRAVLVLGRVQRRHESVPAQMQQEMRRQLRQHGLQPRQGVRYDRQLIDVYRHRGAAVIEPVRVAQWTVRRTPRQSIEAWQSKPGLGGLDPPLAVKTEILQHLRQWAGETLGGLDTEVACDESYVIQGARLR